MSVLTLQERREIQGMTDVTNYMLVMVAVIEAAAWAGFGVTTEAKAAFICWAVAMVWVRPWLSSTYTIALANGNHSLAGWARKLLYASIGMTGISMFSLYTQAIDNYKNHQIAISGPVQMAVAELKKAQLALETAEKNAGYSQTEIDGGMQRHTALSSQLAAAEANARSKHAAQVKAAEDKLAAFWEQKSFPRHNHPNSYIMDENCTPLHNMKSDASALCPKLNQIKKLMPDVSADPEVARLTADLAVESPKVTAYNVISAAKVKFEEAKLALSEAQKTTGVSDGEYVYPPVFHEISFSTKGSVSPRSVSNILGMTGILLVLFSITVIQEGRNEKLKDGSGRLREGAEDAAQSWIDRIPGGRAVSDKLATVVKPHAPEDKDLGVDGKPAQAETGAKVISDGWMVVHANNHILNEGGVKIAEERGIDLDELNRAGLARMNGTDVPVHQEPTVPAAGTTVPDENDMGRVSKAPQRTRKVQSNQSGKVRSDTGTTGAEAHRYQRVRKAVVDRDTRILKQDGTVSYGKIRDYSKHVPDMREINLNVARDTFFPALVRDKIINQQGVIL